MSMGTIRVLCCADAVAKVAVAVEAEDTLSYALWAEVNSRPGPVIRHAREVLAEAVSTLQEGDIEIWHLFADAMENI